MIPPVPWWTGPGLVQSSPRDFWTEIGPVQISTGLVRTGTGPVHSDGISPMSLGVSHTLSHWIVSYKRSHVREKERFWLEEHRKRLRGCDRLPGCEEPHKLRGSMKARQECVGPRVVKDTHVYLVVWWDDVYLPRDLPNIYSPSLSPSPLSLYLRTPPAGFPLPNWVAVVLRNGFSHHVTCMDRSRLSPSSPRLALCGPVQSGHPVGLGSSGLVESLIASWHWLGNHVSKSTLDTIRSTSLWPLIHQQKCKSTIGCATRTRAHSQFIASLQWTTVWRAVYSHLESIHRDVGVGLWTYIQLADGDGPIPDVTAWSLRCYAGTVYTTAASTLHSPLMLESHLGSLLERAALREE